MLSGSKIFDRDLIIEGKTILYISEPYGETKPTHVYQERTCSKELAHMIMEVWQIPNL